MHIEALGQKVHGRLIVGFLDRREQAACGAGGGFLGGIGFTMSIFVGALAFPEGPLLSAAKLGILAASTVSGVIGFAVLKLILARTPSPQA